MTAADRRPVTTGVAILAALLALYFWLAFPPPGFAHALHQLGLHSLSFWLLIHKPVSGADLIRREVPIFLVGLWVGLQLAGSESWKILTAQRETREVCQFYWDDSGRMLNRPKDDIQAEKKELELLEWELGEKRRRAFWTLLKWLTVVAIFVLGFLLVPW